jgi:drug/metabolite transporter (DMT)-like permease
VSERKDIRRFDVTATVECGGALAFWSLGPIFITYLTGYLDSWTQNVLRYSVACLFWLPFLLFSIKTRIFDTRTWRRAIVPALANIIMQGLYAAAFYYIGPAFMTLLAKSSIIWVASFSIIFFAEERPLVRSKRFWLGLVLSVVGVIGVMYFRSRPVGIAASGMITGVVITLAQAFMWAVYTLSVRVAFRDIDSRSGFSVISIYTVAGLFLLALMFGKLSGCAGIGPREWAAVAISAVLSIALSHVLYYAAMRRIGATIPALVILAQPFIVFAISHVVFGESLNIFQVLFGVVLLAGAALAIWAQQYLRRDWPPVTRECVDA